MLLLVPPCRPHQVHLLLRHRPLPRSAIAAFSSSSSSSRSEHKFTTVPVASQGNGFTNGHTIYRVPGGKRADSASDFQLEKASDGILGLLARSNGKLKSGSKVAALRQSGAWVYDVLWDLFLPKNARTSLTADYFPYATWCFAGSVVSCAAGVLSMQSLLYAIGLGAGSIPTAAAVNWVLKDGLGQFGGVLFASVVNNRYDADPKRWRVASSVALDAACLMEILTPLAPGAFLAVASLANVAKNVSWLSASATRAGFHNSFAVKANLADVTAKAGSQAIAASIVGTGLGIAISQWTGASTAHVLGAFTVLSALHLFATYRSVACVQLRTLNCQRLHLVATHFLRTRQIPGLQHVSDREQFISTLLSGYTSLNARSVVKEDATLDQLSHSSPRQLWQLKEFFSKEKYLLNVAVLDREASLYRIDLALEEGATSRDALRAHLHAVMVQLALEDVANRPHGAEEAWGLVRNTYEETVALKDAFVAALDESPWNTDSLLVEERSSRYKWLV